MKKILKKNLIQYGIIGAVALGLYITGYHTQVIAYLQRGVLATGIMDPNVENKGLLAVNTDLSKVDYNMTLVDSEGETLKMEELKGKVIFMNLWATWCPPCIAEMPGINNLYNDIEDEDIVFLMISLDRNFQKAIDFSKENGYDFEVYRVKGIMPQMYASRAIPTTYVIGANETLALTHKGMGDYDTAEFKNFLTNLK